MRKKLAQNNPEEILKYINSYMKAVKFKKAPSVAPGVYGHGPWEWMRYYTTASEEFIKSKKRDQILAIANRFWESYWKFYNQYQELKNKQSNKGEDEGRNKAVFPPKQYSLFAGRVVNMTKDSLKIEISSDLEKVASKLDSIGLFKSAQEMRENRQRRILIKDTLTKDVVKAITQDVKLVADKIRILNTLTSGGFTSEKDVSTAKAELASALEMVQALYQKMYSVYQSSFAE